MEQIRVTEEKLEFVNIDGGGIPIYIYKGKPFTGIIVDYFFNSEIVAGETEYINGYQEGVDREYYESGKIKNEFNSKNNKLHGVCKKWDEEGNLISTTNWENGIKID